eukprot:6613333-Alexandrium_andersonii.AAC.1
MHHPGALAVKSTRMPSGQFDVWHECQKCGKHIRRGGDTYHGVCASTLEGAEITPLSERRARFLRAMAVADGQREASAAAATATTAGATKRATRSRRC